MSKEDDLTEAQLGWLAGMIDGEGNLALGTRKNPNGAEYLDVKVRISGTDIRMMNAVGVMYEAMNLTFFNSLMNRNNDAWKTGINVEVARQGSTRKLLRRILPYLYGKRDAAQAMIDIIDYVRSIPQAGNGVRRDYVEHAEFKAIMARYQAAHKWYYDPSTTTRKAREAISLDGIV